MKTKTVLIIAFCLLAIMAVAQDKPPISIPTYPGAQTILEINMSNEDLSTLLPMFMSGMPKELDGVSEDDINDVLKDIERVEYLQLESKKPDVSLSQLASFYNKNIPEGKWNRVFYMKSANGQVMTVYSQANMAQLYGYRFQTVKVDGKPVIRMDVARLSGRINFEKLMTIAGPLIAKSQEKKTK